MTNVAHVNSKPSRELAAAIERLEKESPQEIEGVVIDLRHNPGGLLNEAVKVSDLFLDAGTKDDRVVEERLLRLLELARRKGSAVGIGHPRSWTWNAIKRNEELLKTSGVDLVFVSELME